MCSTADIIASLSGLGTAGIALGAALLTQDGLAT
jgi:hypothetical protein